MNNLHSMPAIITKKLKRGGQGHGSGRGKTAGRGTKGQKARNTVALHFEGGALPLTKRLPFLRGKGRNKGLLAKPTPVSLAALSVLAKNTTVDEKVLIEHKIVSERDVKKFGVKILGTGEVTQPLTIAVPISHLAAEKIQKAGGTISDQ